MAEYPTAAFVLSLLGGIFCVIGGLVLIGIGAFVDSLGSLGGLGGLSSLTGGLGNFTGNLGNLTSIAGSTSSGGFSIANLGELGVLMGIATVALAVMILKVPERHQLWGASVLVLSILSIAGSLGGLLLGFILGLVGGVLAISWKPNAAAAAPPIQITRICPNCGTVIQKDAKFCSYCGKSLP